MAKFIRSYTVDHKKKTCIHEHRTLNGFEMQEIPYDDFVAMQSRDKQLVSVVADKGKIRVTLASDHE